MRPAETTIGPAAHQAMMRAISAINIMHRICLSGWDQHSCYLLPLQPVSLGNSRICSNVTFPASCLTPLTNLTPCASLSLSTIKGGHQDNDKTSLRTLWSIGVSQHQEFMRLMRNQFPRTEQRATEKAVRTIVVGPKRKPEIRWVIKARKVS